MDMPSITDDADRQYEIYIYSINIPAFKALEIRLMTAVDGR